MSVGCCPPTAWGPLKPDSAYEPRGAVDKAAGGGPLDVYRVGQGDRCVIWNYDVFGFNSGRTKQLCDQLADKGDRFAHALVDGLFHSSSSNVIISLRLSGHSA
jgi:hypothetical protein